MSGRENSVSLLDYVQGKVGVSRSFNALAVVCVVLALFAWVVAHWFGRYSTHAPGTPVAGGHVDPAFLANQVLAMHLLGVGSSTDSPGAEIAGLVLIGVIAQRSGKGGLAVLRVDGRKSITAAVGDEVIPGVVLTSVSHEKVELSRAGQHTTLSLARKK